MKNNYENNLEYLDIEEIIIPKGIMLTIKEVESEENLGFIKVNKDNELVDGIITYLRYVKEGRSKIQVIRINKLQKINIGLASAS
ncbi:hypothetical protein MM239_12245 [Belliella sp. DSM 111904]|uniref:Uncharacterized protein n=1 Tax=Belliella filtrata TaxID=2923435 RepID=A0ABS9V1S3_9BACT|nr:hypothetical protein [Belliella filtrata]MCH7410169.1 hypothetical protein [Belliella filtrata]